jgi:competence protein ComEC
MALSSFLLSYAAGLGTAPFFGPWTALGPAALILAGVWLCVRRRNWSPLLLWGVFFLCGWAQYHQHLNLPQDNGHISAFAGSTLLIVEGTVLERSSRPGTGAFFDIETRTVSSDGISAAVHGRLRLYLREGSPEIGAGDQIRFRARLRRPRLFGTPGEFDFPRFLAGRKIFVTASLESCSEIALLGRATSNGPQMLASRLRGRIGQTIDAGVADAALAPLVKALIIGDKGGVTVEHRQLLAEGGVSHLFAISGLHLGLIALFLYTALRAVYVRSTTLLLLAPPGRFLPALLIPLLYGYLLLTGNALPTRRAFLIALAGAALLLWRRNTPPLKLLFSAAFLLLLIEPLALFEPAFQLSFAGVLGILVLVPRWSRPLKRLPRGLRWIAGVFLSTLAATLTTAPLVLLHFHLLAPAGLLVNLAAIPLIGFGAVPLGLAGIILTPFWPSGAGSLFDGCAHIIDGVLRLLRPIIDLPLLGGWHFYPSPLEMTALFALILALLLPGASRRQILLRAALAATGFVTLAFPSPLPSNLSITALSVGQGESLLVTCASGETYLVDGGGLYSETFDVGERLIAPALGHLGIRSLTGVILTHDHPDHRQGLLYILEHFDVGTFWSAAPVPQLHESLQKILTKRAIPTVLIPPGWFPLTESPRQELAFFVPRSGHDGGNDGSLVVYARKDGAGALLTGDLEEEGVRELVAAMPERPVSLLKLPHHGSRKSAPDLLLDRFAPKQVFASLGAGNPYGFPHPEVLSSVHRRGLHLYRTDFDGTLRFIPGEEDWLTKHWLSGLFR